MDICDRSASLTLWMANEIVGDKKSLNMESEIKDDRNSVIMNTLLTGLIKYLGNS